jgi:hypothetical protein
MLWRLQAKLHATPVTTGFEINLDFDKERRLVGIEV